MMKRPIDERRSSVRAKRIITVRHRLHKRGRKAVRDDWHLSVSQDMSATGLLFVSAFAYELRDVVEVQVVMSGVLDIFNGYGEVVRVNEQKNGAFHVALHYVDLKPQRRSAKSLTDGTKPRKAVKAAKRT
jgi:hypothetical protein